MRSIGAAGIAVATLFGLASEAEESPLGARQAAIFRLSCAHCHARPGLGVPQVGDADAWRARAAQGEDTLLANTIVGLGGMPPLGTCSFCSEDDLRILIRFLTGAAAR
jgi:cytochrome c5